MSEKLYKVHWTICILIFYRDWSTAKQYLLSKFRGVVPKLQNEKTQGNQVEFFFNLIHSKDLSGQKDFVNGYWVTSFTSFNS